MTILRDPPNASRVKPRAVKPFTLAHFRAWARGLVLDTGRPWEMERFQAEFIVDVFAGTPECWLIIPEGNGKTTLVAGLALYHCQHKPTAWVPVAASSREQAEILYRQAEGFVVRSPKLQPIFKCLEGYRRIRCDGMGSRIQVFAADDRTGDGVIPTLCVIDELHRHQHLRLYRTWRGKLEKRQGQIVTISTAGEPGSEFEETRQAIRQAATTITRRGSFVRAASDQIVLHEWAVPEKGNVEDLEVVKAANPFSGVTIPALKRKRQSPTMTLQHWRRMNCNLPTRAENAAIQEAEWQAAAAAEQIPPGARIWLGLDLGWKWDTTALVPLWSGPSFRQLGPARILTPPRDGTMLDPELVKYALMKIHAENPMHTVVMDVTGGADIAAWIGSPPTDITDDDGNVIGKDYSTGLGVEAVIDRGQGAEALALDYARFMEGLRAGQLKHSGDIQLTRHVLNAIARSAGNGKPRFDTATHSGAMYRGDSPRKVIDGLQAAAMVNSVAAAGIDLASNIW